ncbi:MAG: hypothetical protein ACXVHK_32280 [Solirubrobacteraceae bacterium]
MRGDLLARVDERDVGEEESDQALALAHRGCRVAPQRREVCRERPDPGLLLVGERSIAGLGGALVIVLGVGELA